ncbi:MAG: type II CRISPR RNA-guided endonuclease Cas9 [Salibacteraceae bacterium]
MKTILGLDLGTTSIGWALVNEAENQSEKTKIIRTGVRVVPLTSDESTDFAKGKAATINADRTLKRGARRNLQRYKDRRENLIKVLFKNEIISKCTVLTEEGKNSTHTLWKLRAQAASEKISLEDFGRVLLSINKKRGYKSNRKAKDEGDGKAIDGMEVALRMYEDNLTPGQYVLSLFQSKKKQIPDFYRSDLQSEFDKIWNFQSIHYPSVLTNELKDQLLDKNRGQTWKICQEPFELVGIKRTGNTKEQKIENYQWRASALNEKLTLEQLGVVFQEINNQKYNSSGYLGSISDRSKELHFNNETVGQYLFNQIKINPHSRLKNQVFYRQDYLDEFQRIWEVQAQYYKQLTEKLKSEIRDVVIFYQRRLKSQKGLISICELEKKEIDITVDGKTKKKLIGPKVIPKASPLFQEFKIWQILNNLEIRNIASKKIFVFPKEKKQLLFEELNIKGKLTNNQILKLVVETPKDWELNYKDGIEGNNTNELFFKAYQNIADLSGHEGINFSKMDAFQVNQVLTDVFNTIGIDTGILNFDSHLTGKEFEQQKLYQLWHLLYSYEGDNSKTGNDRLYDRLKDKFGIEKEYAHALVNLSFKEDYGSLSAKAIKKILPYLREGLDYSDAAKEAGYNHSHAVTKEENESRELKKFMELLPKNSLRNPVVEKILNQLVNVVNAIIKEYGHPTEIRIELARELKKNAKERGDMTSNINKATKLHEDIRKKLIDYHPFNTGVRITKNDIIKYKLYEELASNGYKTLYTNTYIDRGDLFTKKYDIEHIIPKAVLFDDSFSNKTLATRDFNSREKSNKTGIDAIIEKYGEDSDDYNRYVETIEKLFNKGKGVITKAKYTKLLTPGDKIPDGFIERDLRNSQYIAKKARQMLLEISRSVVSTSGNITDKLRQEWQLINVMKDLNWDKYEKLGLTDYETNKDGDKIRVIKNWTKRNDHRHHAMDALTVAFTTHNHVQYYNFLNARKNEHHSEYAKIVKIEKSVTSIVEDKKGNKRRVITPPMPINAFRAEAKKHLANTLISFKAKNKVVTRNKNKTKKKNGVNTKIELTPRGQLHKETVYGSSKHHVVKKEKISGKFNVDKINQVTKLSYREALLKRLAEYGNDPKKAFAGKNAVSKNPIYVEGSTTIVVPEILKLLVTETQYTIRKEITPDLKIDKVIDGAAKRILQERLAEYGNESKKAFVNLEENPIWLNKKAGIKLKRVTITGVSSVESLHVKKDHKGNVILDSKGKKIPADFVSTGNNHHVAIYRDSKGKLQEKVVSFYEAVMAKNSGLNVIDKNFKAIDGWEFLFTMKQNEMFVFPNEESGFNPAEIDLLDEANYKDISANLFRVQKIGTKDYWFRNHLETTLDGSIPELLFKRRRSPESLKGIMKVRVNHLGKIVHVGEY